MSAGVDDDQRLSHLAILTCLRKSSNRDERHMLLLLMEHAGSLVTGNPINTRFYREINYDGNRTRETVHQEMCRIRLQEEIKSQEDMSYLNIRALRMSSDSDDERDVKFVEDTSVSVVNDDTENFNIELPPELLSEALENPSGNLSHQSVSGDIWQPTSEPASNIIPGPLNAAFFSDPVRSRNSTPINEPVAHQVPLYSPVGVGAPKVTKSTREPFSRENSNVITAITPPGSTSDHEEVDLGARKLSSGASLGNTIYYHERVTVQQLEFFIRNHDLKTKLKEIGGVYTISPATETTHFILSISGPPSATRDIIPKIEVVLSGKDTTLERIKNEDGNIALAIGKGAYLLNMLQENFPKSSITIHKSSSSNPTSMVLQGGRDDVEEGARWVRFFMESPRKTVGTLFHVPPDKANDVKQIRQMYIKHINKIMSHVHDYVKDETGEVLLLAKGCPLTEDHAYLNTLLTSTPSSSRVTDR